MLACALVLATLAVLGSDWGQAHWLVADPERLLAGELWRLLTGPFVAGNLHQLLADLAALAVVAAAYGPGWDRRDTALVLASLALPPLLTLALHPAAQSYYGLSGAVHALLAALLTRRLTSAGERPSWTLLLITTGLGAKLGWELATGTLRCSSPSMAAVPWLPTAHLAGAATGALLSLVLWPPGGATAALFTRRAPTALLGVALFTHTALSHVTEAHLGSMVLTAFRNGGAPWKTDGPPPRLSCGPRALCWYAENELHRSCDLQETSHRIWNRNTGTPLVAVARELTLRSGERYDAVRIPLPALACLSRCQPFIALVDVGWRSVKSHYVVVYPPRRNRLRWYDVNRGFRSSSAKTFARSWKPFHHAAVAPRRCLLRCRRADPGLPP